MNGFAKEPAWVIVTTRSMCEDVVERGFWQAGYRAYVARYRRVTQPHGYNRKPAAVMRPVFPGLVFVQDWRGWPPERISHVVGLMSSSRATTAKLSGQDVAIIMERERTGQFEPNARRPPTNGIIIRDDLNIGDDIEFELSGRAIEAILEGLSEDGMATIRYSFFGRSNTSRIEADVLRVVSG
jgi:hypothetical protein